MIEFLSPERLWLLWLVPLLIGGYVLLTWRARQGHQVRRTQRDLIPGILPRDRMWLRHLAVGLAVLSLISLTVAYARPKQEVMMPRERATVVVAIDISLSMEATDVSPDRLSAAKEAAVEFTNSLPPAFNVSVVSFAGSASVLVPPTQDRGAATRAIESLQVQPATAIGEGIYTSLDALAQVPPDPDNPEETPPARIVLLSDGFTTVGRPARHAAEAAAEADVPVYTIAYGTPTGTIDIEGSGPEPVPVDYAELANVARISGGETYRAESAGELEEVYEEIGTSVGHHPVAVDVSNRYAGAALVFAVLAALGVISLAARWP